MQREWRHWYGFFTPELYKCDLKKVYEDGVNLIDTYCQEYHGAMGLPFWVTVPEGNVSDISFQMGFVGQQTQCAFHLIRHGIRHGIPRMVDKGKGIIDFWVSRSTENSYFPQVWYNVFPPKFKEDYPTYLRTAADGMEGILTAYLYLNKHGETKDEWFARMKEVAQNLGFCVNMKEYKAEPEKYIGSIADFSSIIRMAVTNKKNTPDIYSIMQLLGKEVTINRMKDTIANI